jgi:hypothetical protein
MFGLPIFRVVSIFGADDKDSEPKVYVKAEKNSRGYNYEASVSYSDPDQAMALLKRLMDELAAEYGEQPPSE